MGILRPVLPSIVVGEADHHQLTVLAMGGTGHSADAADDLLFELTRARIVADHRVPADAVRMGSTAAIRANGGETRIARLVYPPERAVSDVSVLSPLGSAMLGLRAGQTMSWTDRDGVRHRVDVLWVHTPVGPLPISS